MLPPLAYYYMFQNRIYSSNVVLVQHTQHSNPNERKEETTWLHTRRMFSGHKCCGKPQNISNKFCFFLIKIELNFSPLFTRVPQTCFDWVYSMHNNQPWESQNDLGKTFHQQTMFVICLLKYAYYTHVSTRAHTHYICT